MKKYVLFAHGGSKNHGCEAIVRTTISALNLSREDVCLISQNPEEDKRYGIDQLCDIVPFEFRAPVKKKNLKYIKAYLVAKLKKEPSLLNVLGEVSAANAQSGDIALSIGGDNYCYGNVGQWVRAHQTWSSGGLKTVLWGCSVEPDVLDNLPVLSDIKSFDLITARETISYEALKKVNPNTVKVTDPAFILEKTELPLPERFMPENTVGINVSPLIMRYGAEDSVILDNYRYMIRDILENTDMHVCLIPHVVWEDNDDRVPSKVLYDEFCHTGRVCMLDDHNAMELKGFIARCRFFVGARTHATIAAYSTCVPTLVVGYSVKSRGIARDLFGQEDPYVVSVQHLKNSDDLAKAFGWLRENEESIRSHLEAKIPEYITHVYDGWEAVQSLSNVRE